MSSSAVVVFTVDGQPGWTSSGLRVEVASSTKSTRELAMLWPERCKVISILACKLDEALVRRKEDGKRTLTVDQLEPKTVPVCEVNSPLFSISEGTTQLPHSFAQNCAYTNHVFVHFILHHVLC